MKGHGMPETYEDVYRQRDEATVKANLWRSLAINYFKIHNAEPEGFCDCPECNFVALTLATEK
jgi:hypothetical protein